MVKPCPARGVRGHAVVCLWWQQFLFISCPLAWQCCPQILLVLGLRKEKNDPSYRRGPPKAKFDSWHGHFLEPTDRHRAFLNSTRDMWSSAKCDKTQFLRPTSNMECFDISFVNRKCLSRGTESLPHLHWIGPTSDWWASTWHRHLKLLTRNDFIGSFDSILSAVT